MMVIKREFKLPLKSQTLFHMKTPISIAQTLSDLKFYNRAKVYEIKCLEKSKSKGGQVSMAICSAFYQLKSVRKVKYEEGAPSHRAAEDGFNWIAYCKNTVCEAYREMVVIPWGFGTFSLSKDAEEIKCPSCSIGQTLVIRNCGFVKANWFIDTVLSSVQGSNPVNFKGVTYDSSMYVFKEVNYSSEFVSLWVQAH